MRRHGPRQASAICGGAPLQPRGAVLSAAAARSSPWPDRASHRPLKAPVAFGLSSMKAPSRATPPATRNPAVRSASAQPPPSTARRTAPAKAAGSAVAISAAPPAVSRSSAAGSKRPSAAPAQRDLAAAVQRGGQPRRAVAEGPELEGYVRPASEIVAQAR